ncbi:MAG: hypothetical protein WCP21_02590 [Armatimonadota bacterium]
MAAMTNRNSDATYQDCYVAVLDILGYKNRVDRAVRSGGHEQDIAFLEGLLDRAYAYVQAKNESPRAGQISLRVFSDTVVIASPATAEGDGCFSLMLATTFIVALFAYENVWVRGAVARGGHYGSSRLIYSPALIEAHVAGEEFADLARILVSPLVARDCHARGQDDICKQREEYLRRSVWRDQDGHFVLNYLAQIDPDRIGDVAEATYMATHKRHVTACLNEHWASPKVLPKYRWVAAYHNSVCHNQLRDAGDQYLIDNVSSTGPLPL